MRLLVCLCSLLSFALPAFGQHAIQSRDGELGVVAGKRGPRVTDRKRYTHPIDIPDEVRLANLVALRGGWLASGSVQVGARHELYLRLLDAGGLKRLPNPREQEGRMRTDPVVLARDGGVLGMVWLEGDSRDQLRVMTSNWLGITWSGPRQLSPEGVGGALALDATLLADGSWLVTWAGFDGEDDEIYWSLVMGDSQTEAQALTDNSVPDILPTVTAVGADAMLAWNAYDGEEYRVRVSRWVEGRWVEGWNESRGTFEPLLMHRDGRPTLLFYRYGSDTEASWDLTEFDGEAKAIRRARVAADSNQRPLVLDIEGQTDLVWPESSDRRSVSWAEPR